MTQLKNQVLKGPFIIVAVLMFFNLSLFASGELDMQKSFDVDLNIEEVIPIEDLSIIYFIMSNTFENNIHRMRGESENQVFTNDDGAELVYDKNGNLVTNDYNKGSYNYAKYEEPFNKWTQDILPWLVMGNTREDPTTFEERLYYYILDMDYGIQTYIFKGRKTDIEKIEYSSLTDTEKEIAHLFYYMLFNENYTVTLSKDNYEKLEANADFYFSYFNQIHDLFGL